MTDHSTVDKQVWVDRAREQWAKRGDEVFVNVGPGGIVATTTELDPEVVREQVSTMKPPDSWFWTEVLRCYDEEQGKKTR